MPTLQCFAITNVDQVDVYMTILAESHESLLQWERTGRAQSTNINHDLAQMASHCNRKSWFSNSLKISIQLQQYPSAYTPSLDTSIALDFPKQMSSTFPGCQPASCSSRQLCLLRVLWIMHAQSNHFCISLSPHLKYHHCSHWHYSRAAAQLLS